jgi:hypothetical protein
MRERVADAVEALKQALREEDRIVHAEWMKEVNRLRAEIKRQGDLLDSDPWDENLRLKAEVERLNGELRGAPCGPCCRGDFERRVRESLDQILRPGGG